MNIQATCDRTDTCVIAYDVIEMCAPAAPPIRLPIPNPNPKH